MKKLMEEFYPTPERLLEKIMSGMKWQEIGTVLEPSAGKGDIVDFICEKVKVTNYGRSEVEIDCIEIDETLRATLKGKEYRVVHDDFLTFHTFKQYDLIVMNPPFSCGDAHLAKALEMQKYGGGIICILNAETLRNPCTNLRKQLLRDLEDYHADIQYIKDAFVAAERSTAVEIAVVKVSIPKTIGKSRIWEHMKTKQYSEQRSIEVTAIEVDDIVKATVNRYNLELESGLALIREYQALSPYILDSMKEVPYNQPILSLRVEDHDLSVNRFVCRVRQKYWSALFNNEKFTAGMTSKMRSDYSNQVHELANYDFSEYNIREVQISMKKNIISSIEECIMALFEEFTAAHAWYPECERNIHYFNGWATNKAWIINKKVIVPLQGYHDLGYSWGGFKPTRYEVLGKLADIEKALNYLDGGLTENRELKSCMQLAESTEVAKDICLKYFDVTFYKKGTCHITFRNDELLKKFNIFAARQKKWLPQEYGKKHYSEMNNEEKAVIDSFEGKESYEKTMANTGYFLYEPTENAFLLEMSA